MKDDAFHTYVINGRNALGRGLSPGQPLTRLSAFPDLHVRRLAADIFSELQAANMITQRRLTEGELVDVQQDPDTLEHLKGLGYVN